MNTIARILGTLTLLIPIFHPSEGSAKSPPSVNSLAPPLVYQVLVLELGKDEGEDNPKIALVSPDGYIILRSTSSDSTDIFSEAPSFVVEKIAMKNQGHNFKEEPLIVERGMIEGAYFPVNGEYIDALRSAFTSFQPGQQISLKNFLDESYEPSQIKANGPLNSRIQRSMFNAQLNWVLATNFFLGAPIWLRSPFSLGDNPALSFKEVVGHNAAYVTTQLLALVAINSLSQTIAPTLLTPNNRKWFNRVVGIGSSIGCGLAIKTLVGF